MPIAPHQRVVQSLSKWGRRKLALAGYRHREQRRKRTNFPTKWLSQAALIAADLADVADVQGKGTIDIAFIERVASARDAASSMATKLAVTSYTIYAYFLLALLAIDVPISLFGIELKRVNGLNELLLIGSALLNVIGVFQAVRANQLSAAIRGAIDAGFEAPVQYLYKLSFLPGDYIGVFTPTYRPHLVWSPWKVRISMASAVLALVFIFGGVLALSAFRIYTAFWVLIEPTTVNGILRAAAMIVPVVDLGAMIFALVYVLPLPHRDYFKDHQWMALKDTYPEDADTLAQEMYGESWADVAEMRAKGYLP